MTEEEKVNNAYMLAGQRGMKGLLAIVNSSEEDWNALTESIAGCNGAADEMSDTMVNTFSGKAKVMKNNLEDLQMAVGDRLTPALGELADMFAKAFKGLAEFVEKNDEAVPIITGVATALGVFTASITVATVAVKAFEVVSGALGVALGPVGIALGVVGAAVGLLAATFIDAADDTDEAKEAIDRAKEAAEEWETTRTNLKQSEEDTMGLVQSLITLTSQTEKSAATNAQIKSTVDQLNSSVEGLNLSYDEQTGTLNMSTEALEQYVHTLMLQKEAEAIIDRMVELDKQKYDLQEQLTAATTEYNDAQKDVDDTIAGGKQASATQLTRLEQAEEKYNDLTGQLNTTTSEYEDLEGQYNDIDKEISENTKLIKDATGGTEELGDATGTTADEMENWSEEMQDAHDKLADLSGETMAAIESGTDLRDKYEELSKTFEKYKDAADADTVAMVEQQLAQLNLLATNQELADSYGYYVSIVEGMGVPLENLSQWLIDNEITADEWGKGVSTAFDGVINGFGKLDTSLDMSLDEMATNLQYNIDAYHNWGENIQQLMDAAVAKGDASAIAFVQYMQNMGIGAAAQVAQMADDIDGTFALFGPKFNAAGIDVMLQYYSGVENGKQTGVDIFTGLGTDAATALTETDMESAGAETMEQAAAGMEGQTETVVNAAEAVADAAASGVENKAPDFKAAGTKWVTQIKVGMLTNKNSVSVAAGAVANTASSAINSVSWYNLGWNISSGVARGVSAASYLIKRAAINAAQSAYNAAKEALGIHSPSRVMAEIGRYYDEGFARGITENVDTVTKAAQAMAKESAYTPTTIRERSGTAARTADEADEAWLRDILEKYLPEMLKEMKAGKSISMKELAKAISPYVDNDLGQTERRKNRGN